MPFSTWKKGKEVNGADLPSIHQRGKKEGKKHTRHSGAFVSSLVDGARNSPAHRVDGGRGKKVCHQALRRKKEKRRQSSLRVYEEVGVGPVSEKREKDARRRS